MIDSPDWDFFGPALLDWYRPDRRPMPWKAIDDPYAIWLSEIILQQTRVEQGRAYYERFLARFPTVGELAAAADDEVLKLWEGLGYYSRARNLLKAARMVAGDLGGVFPNTYGGLRQLPGVGPYTAAAIASFAFDRQVAVLDGNVFRILARYANDGTPIDTGKGKKHFQELVDRALGTHPAKFFNQAIMDFGALVCTPKSPSCPICPLREKCRARAAGAVDTLPVKSKRLRKRTRFFHYLYLRDDRGRLLIHQRGEGDIWQQLYEFPLLETDRTDLTFEQLKDQPTWPEALPKEHLQLDRRYPPVRTQLTHQTINIAFHGVRWSDPPDDIPGYQIISNEMLDKYAFPRPIARFLADKSLFLDLF